MDFDDWTQQNPFTLAAEDLMRLYFFNYWSSTGKFPPFYELIQRVGGTDWLRSGQYNHPDAIRMRQLYEKLKQEVC